MYAPDVRRVAEAGGGLARGRSWPIPRRCARGNGVTMCLRCEILQRTGMLDGGPKIAFTRDNTR